MVKYCMCIIQLAHLFERHWTECGAVCFVNTIKINVSDNYFILQYLYEPL